jgi:hypothetical protein
MKKMLRFEMHGSVEVPGDSPVGALYSSDRGRRVGEIVSQMEASDLPELGSISRLSFECALRALIKHGSMIEAIKLLRQYVGLDENGNLRMGLREAKDICDGLKAEMNRPLADEQGNEN